MEWMRDSAWGFVGVIVAVIAVVATVAGIPPVATIAISIIIILVFIVLLIFKSRSQNKASTEQIEHDRNIFRSADQVMSEDDMRDLLEQLMTDYSYRIEQARKPRDFIFFFNNVGNQYMSKQIQNQAISLATSVASLIEFLTNSFFVYPESQGLGNIRLCLYPELDPSRAGTGSQEDRERFRDERQELENRVHAVYDHYRLYREKIKAALFV